MTPRAFDKVGRGLPGVTVEQPWEGHDVYKVGGRMFAVYSPGNDSFSFKASDIAFEVLTGTGPGKPAPYLARAKWVWFASLQARDEAEVADWLRTAHGLVAARLTRKARAALGL
ncbi:MAG: MmcQ/YjbR family DNA-binding protein [Pseudomonadota bacterium]